MKLKNKLLPLIGAGAVLATVAPISLASCGATSDNGFIDLTKKYNPSIEYYTGVDKFTNNFEAMEAYAKEASKNPEIVVQDYIWSSSKVIMNQVDNYNPDNFVDSIYDGLPTKHEIKISNPDVKMVINPEGYASIYHLPLVSLTVEYSYTYQYDNEPEDAIESLQHLVKAEENGKIEFTNIPYWGSYWQLSLGYDSVWLWRFKPDLYYMMEEPMEDYPWTIKMEDNFVGTYSGYDPVKGAYTYTKEKHENSLTKSTDEDISEQWIDYFTAEFNLYSHYFWLVGCDERPR